MQKIKSIAQSILKFLNVVDRKGNLSITNVAVIIVVTKIAIAQSVGITEAGALLITLMNYGHKRQEDAKAAKEALNAEQSKARAEKEQSVSEVADQVKELASKMADSSVVEEIKKAVEKVVDVQNKITTDMVMIKSTHELVAKTAEESKKLLSQNNLAAAFQPRKG